MVFGLFRHKLLLDGGLGWGLGCALFRGVLNRINDRTFFRDGIINIHSFRRYLPICLGILFILEPISDVGLVMPGEFLVCMCTGIKSGLQVIPSLEKRRDYDKMLDI